MLIKRIFILAAIISLIALAGCSDTSDPSNPVNEKNDIIEQQGKIDYGDFPDLSDIDANLFSDLNIPACLGGNFFECDSVAMRGIIRPIFEYEVDENGVITLEGNNGGRICIAWSSGDMRITSFTGHFKITLTGWEGRFIPRIFNEGWVYAPRVFIGEANHIRVEWTVF
ncbi:MAG: hypothetical protein GY839_00515 [candidate division Zixibacteria bacterium]|nr:hypothetical protein [candidate division Zixibacteria bacterium]